MIKLTGIDNLGLVSEITQQISKSMTVNIRNINFESSGGLFTGRITVIVKNNSILNSLTERLKKINGIDKVTRE